MTIPSRQRPNIALGLAVLSTVNTGGQALSLRDIAEVCECHPQAIHDIEKRALRKLRYWLNEDQSAGELVAAMR
jgi:DNA-directed RNA polymerase sigma subunit (sigma70/sigma32)